MNYPYLNLFSDTHKKTRLTEVSQDASTTPISTPAQALSGRNQKNFTHQEKAPAYRNKPGTNNQGASTTPISAPAQALSGRN